MSHIATEGPWVKQAEQKIQGLYLGWTARLNISGLALSGLIFVFYLFISVSADAQHYNLPTHGPSIRSPGLTLCAMRTTCRTNSVPRPPGARREPRRPTIGRRRKNEAAAWLPSSFLQDIIGTVLLQEPRRPTIARFICLFSPMPIRAKSVADLASSEKRRAERRTFFRPASAARASSGHPLNAAG